jgi:membrane fusion protein (multidrug efflux system)
MGLSRAQILILLSIALVLPACGSDEQRPHDADGRRPQDNAGKIAVTVVQSKSATIKHDYKCTDYGQYYIEVRAPADGVLAELTVKEGQPVKKGDPLFKIRPPGEKEKKPDDRDRAASAAMGRAITYGDGLFRIIPPEEEEKPMAESRNGVISLTATSDGVIARLSRQPGHFVWKDDFLTTVVSTSVIWVYFRVPENDYLDSVAEGSRDGQRELLTLTLADGSKFPHAGQSLGPLSGSNEDVNSLRFGAKFPNPEGLLRSGRSGTVSISREWKDAIFLPRRATFQDRDQRRYVYVVHKDHVAHRRAVVIGDGTEDHLVVKEGVEVGDRIVADGIGEVRDGDKVE